jgi:hypothetical protein
MRVHDAERKAQHRVLPLRRHARNHDRVASSHPASDVISVCLTLIKRAYDIGAVRRRAVSPVQWSRLSSPARSPFPRSNSGRRFDVSSSSFGRIRLWRRGRPRRRGYASRPPCRHRTVFLHLRVATTDRGASTDCSPSRPNLASPADPRGWPGLCMPAKWKAVYRPSFTCLFRASPCAPTRGYPATRRI